MSPASRARFWMALTFLLIALLVVGGLGWVTGAALRLELSDRLRLALWQLDSRISPSLAREDGRPYQHFSPLYIPLPALQRNGAACSAGTILVPSPLLSAELPDWMLLHWQTTLQGAWRSPQVLTPTLAERLRQPGAQVELTNVTPERAELLARLRHYSPDTMVPRLPAANAVQTIDEPSAAPQQAQAESQAGAWSQAMQAPNRDGEFLKRAGVQKAAKEEARGGPASNSGNYKVVPLGDEITWQEIDPKFMALNPATPLSAMIGNFKAVWLRADGEPDELVIARLAQVGDKKVIQGVLLDWSKVRDLLFKEIRDLFPDGRLEPVFSDVPEFPERMMTALPVQLNPGPAAATILPGWSPLRTGLLLAWVAALGALTVVGWGGWSLLDLSERRIRFVSSVTHELRTPLTTLRLYLDMLTGGLVTGEQKRNEYLQTLHGESDRLHRLVSNVLDFARLERQRPKLALKDVAPSELLDQVYENWSGRCKAAGKELVMDSSPDISPVRTDPELIQQILGSLIDNACKYSRNAADERIWLRWRREMQTLVFEVEDRGPGVPPRDRRGIFRAFRRGESAEFTAGGVGLGLALARRWAHLLGGRLDVVAGRDGVGACFQLRV